MRLLLLLLLKLLLLLLLLKSWLRNIHTHVAEKILALVVRLGRHVLVHHLVVHWRLKHAHLSEILN